MTTANRETVAAPPISNSTDAALIAELKNKISEQETTISKLREIIATMQEEYVTHYKNMGKTEVLSDVVDKLWKVIIEKRDDSQR